MNLITIWSPLYTLCLEKKINIVVSESISCKKPEKFSYVAYSKSSLGVFSIFRNKWKNNSDLFTLSLVFYFDKLSLIKRARHIMVRPIFFTTILKIKCLNVFSF